MRCKTVQKYIPDYLSGDLAPAKLHAFKRHIDQCHRCSEELELYRSYFNDASAIRIVKAPADFLDRVHLRLQKKLEQPGIRERLKMLMPYTIPYEAVGLAAIALVVFFFWKPYEPAKIPFTEYNKEMPEQTSPAPSDKSSAEDQINDFTTVSKSPVTTKPLRSRIAAPAEPSVSKDKKKFAEKNRAYHPEAYSRAKKEIAIVDQARLEEEAEVMPASLPKIIVLNLTLKSETMPEGRIHSADESNAVQNESAKNSLLARKSHDHERTSYPSAGSALSKGSIDSDGVLEAVEKTGGTVIEALPNNNGVMLYYIVEIPVLKFNSFYSEISTLGTITNETDARPQPDQKSIRIRINIQ